jgi:hypothetical protein
MIPYSWYGYTHNSIHRIFFARILEHIELLKNIADILSLQDILSIFWRNEKIALFYFLMYRPKQMLVLGSRMSALSNGTNRILEVGAKSWDIPL